MEIEDPLLTNQFIHELMKPGEHLDSFWLETFPKKLNGRLEYISGQRAVGWGIYINEKLNWPIFLSSVLVVLIIIGIGVILFIVLRKDLSSAMGLGAYLVAVLTLIITLQYYRWQEL